MSRHGSFSRILSFLLSIVLVLTLFDPAAHAAGFPEDETLQMADQVVIDDPSDIEDEYAFPYEELSEGDDEPADFEEAETAAEEGIVLSPEVIAQDISEPVPSPYDGTVTELCDDTIISELPEKRDTDTIQFRLNDGSISAAIYSYPVHERDAEGVFQEIDNRLTLEKGADGFSYYSRSSLHDKVLFAEVPEDGRLITIETEKGYIRWGLTGIGEGVKPAVLSPVSIPEGYSLLVPKSAGDHLQYSDILPFIHADYRILGQTIKEDIVLESPAALEALDEGLFSRLAAEGYTVSLKDEQTISLLNDEGEEVYQISAPVMTDAAGTHSTELSLSIKTQEDGSFLVRLLPDMDWLHAEDRIFPVTIDPSLAYLIGGYSGISASTTFSSVPGFTETNYLECGRSNQYGNLRGVFKINTLPSLSEADTVIDARITFVVETYSAYGSSHLGPVTANLHPLTESVNVGSVTWNSLQGKYSSIVTDGETVLPADMSTSAHPRVTWDITRTVKDWYLSGSNYGCAMISENESASTIRLVTFYSVTSTNDQTILPVFQMTYLNQEGMEPYLSYHSSGSDTMGIINVSDFSGNLVYTYDDISMSGAYMPISLSHVYNASQKANANPVGASHMLFGKGMRLNVGMKVTTSSVSGYPYKLTDADGTVHYFSLKSGTSGAEGSVYVKEFDTNTKLTKTSTGYTLEDGGNISYTFNSYGYLKTISDITNGKTQTIGYGTGQLAKVTDGGGRIVNFSYNSSDYLTGITDPAGRTTTYAYDANGCLSTITRPDGSTVTLNYTAKGGGYLISKITDIDGASVEITYYNSAPYRVKQLLEKSSSGGEGRRLIWTYNAGETTITDRQGRSETMLFDNSGHTVCIRDNAGGAVSGNYNNSNDNKKHALIYASSMQGSVTNYLVNHGFENSSLSWGNYNSSNTEGSYALDTGTVYEGTKSLKLISTGSAASFGVYETVTVPEAPGKSVTLSAYIYYEDYTPSTGGFYFNIRYKNAAGSWVHNYSHLMQKVTGWHRESWTVNIPEDASSDSIQAAIVFYKQVGTCYIDSVQFEEGAVSNRYNMLENGHVRNTAGTARPGYWSGSGLESTDAVITEGHTHLGYQMTGNSQTAKYIYQNVPVKNGASGDSYVFGVWAKADSIAKVGLYKNNNRYFAVRIRFIKSDDTYTESFFSFEAKTPNWQYLSGTATASSAYVKVQVALLYNYQKNTVVFDDICLFRERYGDRYTYDSEGRVTKVTDQAGLVTSYTYLASGRPEVSKITYPDGTVVNYTYNTTNHRLTSVTDSSGRAVNYSYDSNGNPTAATTTTGGKTISSPVNAYSGAYLSSVTDPFGNVTSYSYTQSKGTLNSLTNAKSVTTNYTYNANNDLLTKVKTGSSEVRYSYTNRRLTSLVHNTASATSGDVTYNLQYNAFGTQTAVKVGTQSLVSYTYASNNGDLTKTQYGNGQYLTPTYDSLGRVSKLSYNGSAIYEYYYGTNGKVGLIKDLAQGINWRYEYDQAGRPISLTGPGKERHTYAYSSSTGELISDIITNEQGSSTYGTYYTYGPYNGTSGERMLQKITMHGSRVKVLYDYDDFYRSAKTVLFNNNYTLNTSYSWRAGSGSNRTSYMPTGQTEVLKDAGGNTITSKSLDYTYDSLGNIETIAEGGTQRQKYYYDSLNQLIREDNLDLNQTIVYSYDLGGNIISTQAYPYQTGATVSGTPSATNTYTYGDSNWKDKLTAYNGSSITYDAIGNPTSYYNGYTFTWQKGRQLAGATNGTNTVSYTYNNDGYRTSKTVNGTLVQYTLEGSQVRFEKNGSLYLWYYYDASGAPVAFSMQGTPVLYFYRKNLQGDVTGVYKGSTGALLVSYVYDAWGKVTATDVAGTTESADVLTYNPYLYRGYRYDAETGLYYLNSRYYDPETGRFINADDVANIGAEDMLLGHNLFAYCLNNPVNCIDEEGTWSSWTTFFTTVAAAAFVVAMVAINVATVGAATLVGAAATTVISIATEVATIATDVAIVSAGMATVSSVTDTVENITSISIPVTHSEKSTIVQAKGHQGNMRDNGLIDKTDEEIQQEIKNPNTSKKEKQRLVREQKARGRRNVRKRDNYLHLE